MQKAQVAFNKTFSEEPRRYTQAEVDTLIDRDRVHSFIIFVDALPRGFNGQVFGTARQVRSIVRVLRQLGFSAEPQ
jgi:hypothetical protein